MASIASRPQKSTTKLQKEAAQIALEIQMLVFAAGELAGAWQSPIHPAEGHRERMATECFLLHFRNLSGFFGMRAADYGGNVDSAIVSMLMDEHVHAEQIIGFDGFTSQAACGRRDVARMIALMEDALHNFLGKLKPQKVAWFLEQEHTRNALVYIEGLIPMLASFPMLEESPPTYRN